MKKLTRDQKRQIAAVAAKKDADIDLSEMPEVLDWSGAEIGKFYRPPKKPVTMRLDTDIISWLKGYGRGYQTKANVLLRHAMMNSFGRARQKLNKQTRGAAIVAAREELSARRQAFRASRKPKNRSIRLGGRVTTR
ncbi:MAG: BrnA antitoxin family protein [Candidatus Sulfotelmatobacter sp.]